MSHQNSISISSKRLALIVAVIGGLWAFVVSAHNYSFVETQTNARFSNGMITTADDASYIRPAENFNRNGIWKDNTQGVSSYIQRPPGMGFIHLLFYKISPTHYPILHKLFALFLHILALYIFGLMALELLGKRAAIFTQIIYAVLPCFWGYLFYYLTESLTISSMVFLFYGYVKYHLNPNSKWLILQALICGILLMVRPQLIFFIIPFLYFMIHFFRRKDLRKWSVLLLVFILGFGTTILWELRSITIAKRITGLHEIYDATNNTQYRPTHRSFVELFKIWEHSNEKFHSTMRPFWNSLVYNESTPDSAIQNALNNIPDKAYQTVPKKEFDILFEEYILSLRDIKYYVINNQPVPGETDEEIRLGKKIDSIASILKKKMWLENYITTPFHSAKFMFTKSQLNMAIFQKKYRGLWWMEVLRASCLIIILISTMLTLLNIFSLKNRPVFLFAVATIIYLVYLFFVHQINEERYLVPLLPIFLLIAICTIFDLMKRVKK